MYIYSCDLTPTLRESLDFLYPTKPEGAMKCVEIGSFQGEGRLIKAPDQGPGQKRKGHCIHPPRYSCRAHSWHSHMR